MESRTTAKDFFLHLGSMVALYASVGSFIVMIFRIIDKAYPEIASYSYYSYAPSISFQVATLIIVFPIFLVLSWLNEKSYALDPSKKSIGVRRWLTYITLFVGGVILAGDLVTVLYKFLDGQNLTNSFLLKALTLFLVSGVVFGYYLQDIRDKINGSRKRAWAIAALIIVILSIVLGFSIIGSPARQRLAKYDDQKVNDLSNIQYQVLNYWQRKGSLPQSLSELSDPLSGFVIPKDPQGKEYSYKRVDNDTFELCADFNLENSSSTALPTIKMAYDMSNEYWNHKAGNQCFERTIDPKLYPVLNKY